MYYPDEDNFSNQMLDQFRRTMQVLQGCNLIDVSSRQRHYSYAGPNVYMEWCSRQAEEYGVSECSFPVTAEEEGLAKSHTAPPTKNVTGSMFDGNSMTKFLYREEMTKSIDKSTLTPEQQRSLRYIHAVCRCGKNNRKHRCRKCEQCTAPPCNQCGNCLNPSRKQACVGKVCLFPIIPDCRCFGK